MTGSVFVGSFCMFGMIFWAIRHPVLAVAYVPLAGFAIFSIVLGNRALFYSAPFSGLEALILLYWLQNL